MNRKIDALMAGLFLTAAVGLAGASGSQEPKVETFTVTTDDGLVLEGQLTLSGPNFVLLSNQHHATEFLWASFIPDLTAAGWTVMTYNYRGIGGSQGPEDVPNVDRDLKAAYAYAVSKGARRIALVGASLGSIVSLKLAPTLRPTSVVLLSVARGFLGMNLAPDPAEGLEAPTLLVTSEYDFAREDTEAVAAQLAKKGELFEVPASDHGTALLDGPYADEVRAKVLGFLKKTMK